MSLLYSYGTGSSASADRYSTVDELLSQLPDNTANLIVPQDLRDSVFSLWERVSDVELIAGSAASASSYFQNTDPTPVAVGGIPAGTTFPTPTDMQTMWTQLLYPYVEPTLTLTISGASTREYGNPLGLVSNSITLNWGVTRNSSPTITSITVDGDPFAPTNPAIGTTQSGTNTATGTHSWVGALSSETQTFTMVVNDSNPSVINKTVNLTWKNKIYWGSIDFSSAGNPNLTTNPGDVVLITGLCNDAGILGLAGSELSSTKNKTYDNIDGAGDYIIFAWPSSVSGSQNPVFTVNGLQSTAFTRVRNNSSFTNVHGFTTNYEVWVSNTLQNSPIDVTISD